MNLPYWGKKYLLSNNPNEDTCGYYELHLLKLDPLIQTRLFWISFDIILYRIIILCIRCFMCNCKVTLATTLLDQLKQITYEIYLYLAVRQRLLQNMLVQTAQPVNTKLLQTPSVVITSIPEYLYLI